VRQRPTTFALSLAAAALALPLAAPPGAAAAPPVRATPYANPVGPGEADTYADPAVIRGKDGWWYAFGTTDPLREGEGTRHLLPISRSQDLVDWEFVGDAFTEDSAPAWLDRAVPGALWAPDIRYVEGEYRLYYVVTDTTLTDERNDGAIGVATAPTPAGPWTDSGEPVVGPRRGTSGAPGDFLWTFDPHHVTDADGTEHLFYGSYYGGIFVTELDATGRRAVGTPTQVAIDNKYEGAYVVRRDGWWYLFASSANCCAGPTTGYSVHVGRARDLRGPYVDREGQRLDVSRAGGTPVLAPNGNRWVGTGHNAVVTDLAGQDWMAYHAIDRQDPYLDGTEGINERPMLIDRLDWVGGWPTVRAGAWASEGRQRGPVTGGAAATRFEHGWGAFARTGRWSTPRDTATDSRRYARAVGHASLLAPGGSRVRVEADVRQPRGGALALVAGAAGPGRTQVRATVDADRSRLVLSAHRGGRVVARASAALAQPHDAADWHSAVLEVRDGTARAELSDARLFDPEAALVLRLPRDSRLAGPSGVVTGARGGEVDNLSALPAHRPVTRLVEQPRPGRTVFSDAFDGRLRPGWERVRAPRAAVRGGDLVWPVEVADLGGPGGTASLLLRDAPQGDWTVQTRVSLDVGVEEIRNFQQAGLVAHVDDDRWVRLSHVAIWNTRQTEFGTERPYLDRLQYGGTIVGPPARTTWLRISRTEDASGEQELQASTSRDGRTWVRGGVWTLPAGADVRVGLAAHGGQEVGGVAPPPATARFHEFRITRD
jgi:regulation of enolase protein 1 (concanavalin A-like superfamily)